ncbi:MAG: Arginine-tRNA ligase [Candidatus Wolfebacteria bacterium GW2011_GWC1_43_10]|uniref:Arginine--tRNA ligase n=2 Tax=Candidatus Wolfeibacteriota TaxID=1752735 RepID=A0A0G1CAI0_9BACT|nr:MAG: Arginine-tRNA ligase [Candidatus Wolfebacteria bacterium GW2011_GWC1_43_10]KKT22669.1 MAG: Arginine-tRNA ligase [Parcubacteria group bacterium GW2011_GWB1_43_8b]OGM90097.1 MAG: arginine--tRNA ligase [Candidatus Wolfebacteria bacterium GWA1_42_9]
MISPQQYLENLVKKAARKLTAKLPHFEMESKNISRFGDYSSNVAFSLAKILKKSPIEIARKIKSDLEENRYLDKIEIAGGGFINFFFKKDFWLEMFKNPLAKINPGKGKKVIIDYSSPNIAKPMHVGHLRATLIGDFLARLYKFLDFKVIGWNHLGDWGTQFGMLIAGYKKWGDKKKINKEPIRELLEIYVRFNREIKNNPRLLKQAQEEFAKLERQDKENKKILNWFLRVSLKEFNQLYKKLGILPFSVVKGESEYEKQLIPLINDLKNKGVAILSQGAYIIPLEKYSLPPALVQKSDGATLYLTREIASLIYRVKKYQPDEILYVIGSQQNLHLKQLFAIAQIAGLSGKAKLRHVSFGWVLGPNGKKLATREGEIIEAQKIVDQIINTARKIVSQKRKDLSKKEKEKIARIVGLGGLKYNFLKDGRNSDIVFDPKKALSLQGNSAPYLQYTYVRLKSILAKTKTGKGDFSLFEDKDIEIIKKLTAFEDVLENCLKDSSSHHLAEYLFGLANLANNFYETTPILKDKNIKRRNARLALIKAAAGNLETGLELMGIETLNRI